jgi:TolB-like protein/DNA-binding winged helix-turn-helix (wHTH) protein
MKSFHPFQLDPENHCLWRGEERLQITPKAFDVLRYMVEKAGSLVTQEELLEALWPNTFVNPEVLRKYILEIRRVLGDRAENPVFIETVTKRGYRFVAPVTEEPTADTPARNATQEFPSPALSLSGQEAASAKKTKRHLAFSALLVLLGAAVIVGYFWRARSGMNSPNNTSIVVLPFADMSPGKDEEYFSDGLTEEMINDLAKVPGLKVVARSSAFQFKGKNEDLRSVGQKLGVANILEGSVRKDGDHVRISAALIKADDGFQLWSETYDRDVGQVLTAQDEIARAVRSALQVRLMNGESAALPVGGRATNSEAYQAYLQGQYFIARGQDKEDLDQALSYAEQAIKLDANYAPAWAQRSQVLESLAAVAMIDNTDGYRRARESAEKAIALDPNLATGYLAMGLVQINHDWDWEGADTSLKKAGLLEPGSAPVIGARAYLARNLGRTDEAIELYQQAIALDPLRANYHVALGYVLALLGRYTEAKTELQKTQELNPQLAGLHLTRGKIFLSEGRPQEALAEMQKETAEWEKLWGESLAYFALGRRADSDNALKKLIATHQDDCAYQIAEVYAYRGETEKEFEWFERAVRQRDPGAPELKINPIMKNLRQGPHYAELLKKMNLPI